MQGILPSQVMELPPGERAFLFASMIIHLEGEKKE